MTMTKEQGRPVEKLSEAELDKLVEKAIKKVHAAKENDLCKYLPGPAGGYIHHFTLKKLRATNPGKFFSLIQEFIIDSDRPITLDPKPRAPRGSRKRKEVMTFTRNDVEKVLELARKFGDKDLLTKFSPRKTPSCHQARSHPNHPSRRDQRRSLALLYRRTQQQGSKRVVKILLPFNEGDLWPKLGVAFIFLAFQ